MVQRFRKNKGGDFKARKASKKIKTIAERLTRELSRKLPPNALNKWGQDLSLFEKVLAQKRGDSNKVYSLHEPDVKCYTKGKEHKRFEFGSKVSVFVTQRTGVIVGALNFTNTLHDSKTLPLALEQYQRLNHKQAKNLWLDRGYKGPKKINETLLHTPKPDKNITKIKRKKHSRRAAIEPLIGHLKQHFRMARNFLKGAKGDATNLMMAAAAWNFKRVMNLLKAGQFQFYYQLIVNWLLALNFYYSNLKLTF